MHNLSIDVLKNNITSILSANSISLIQKGYSSDKKYLVSFADGQRNLLRIGKIESYERKSAEIKVLQQAKRFDVQCPEPIEIGKFKELGLCYYIVSYIEGEEAREYLPLFTEDDQKKIGVSAGKDLARIHRIPAPNHMNSWYERAMSKHYRYTEAYKTCGIKLSNDEKILAYIEENKHLLKSRPNQLQHDDFGPSNLIIKDKKYSGVIDFNNFDWGDPYHDFVKIALFTTEISIPFSIGQLNGYFNGKIPEDFWKLYSVYVAMVLFSSIIWSQRFAPGQLEEMKTRLERIIEEHHNFELQKPTWFTQENDETENVL
ncbi:aminoglycoside phosphotransferase [Lottiidibacillus patelloidae]|uniref:Aminoglycoside phosphotransferase n=1 Tax=Lottiidibacillus patelloidae TaxID=2670334 RepID=A0A263BXC9_9BACI|nr:phosphotransferase [Lottiidibacillus patelloidae]OZM58222.1 aminoglycoside phosphotransferase [Lottiidibacillus patelloidae]